MTMEGATIFLFFPVASTVQRFRSCCQPDISNKPIWFVAIAFGNAIILRAFLETGCRSRSINTAAVFLPRSALSPP